jgi:hypothetical protein
MTSSLKIRVAPALPLALLLLVAVASYGQTAAKKGPTAPAAQRAGSGGPGQRKYVTLTGEILDMGCFTSHGLRGALHRACALQCLAMGVPIGLITADSTVYVLTQNHDRAMAPTNFPPPDPYSQCRGWPSFQIEVSGFVWERKGTKVLEVIASKPAPPPATSATTP